MNSINISGRLTKDPSLATIQSGNKYCKFTVAVDRPFQKDKTDFIDVIAWDKTAELVAKYLTKGRQVIVQGSLQIDTYEVDGAKRTKAVVRADRVEFIGSNPNTAQNQNAGATDTMDSDIDRLKPTADYDDMPF